MSWIQAGATVAGAYIASEEGGGEPATREMRAPAWWRQPARRSLERAEDASRDLEFIQMSPQQKEALRQQEALATGEFVPGQTAEEAGALARQTLSGDFLDPSTNPELGATIDAATGRVIDRFERDIMPQLGSAAQRQGAWGGSRQGIAEARAADEVTQNVGEITSSMLSDAYNRERQRQTQAMQMAPSIFNLETSAALTPAQILGDVGNTRRGFAQEAERFPFERAREMTELVSSVNPRGGFTTQTQAQPSTAVKGMRGALGGAQIGSLFSNPQGQDLFGGGVGSANQYQMASGNRMRVPSGGI